MEGKIHNSFVLRLTFLQTSHVQFHQLTGEIKIRVKGGKFMYLLWWMGILYHFLLQKNIKVIDD